MTGEEDQLYQLQQVTDENTRKLSDHIQAFKDHEKQSADKYNRLMDAQQANTTAIADLAKAQQANTEAVSSLVDDTREVIRLSRDFQGAARVGKGLQGFMLWMMKWGAIGAGVAAGINWAIEYFKA